MAIKSIILYTALVLTGLSAGLFFAWSVSVIPGTKKVMDLTYLETMQSINRAILNPLFFVVFIGSMICMTASSIQLYGEGISFWLILSAGIVYFAGTFLVTGLGNVPLNNLLEVLPIQELSLLELKQFRENYEQKWNLLHSVRTGFAMASFILTLAAVITYTKHL